MQTIKLQVTETVKAQGGIDVVNPLIMIEFIGCTFVGEESGFNYLFSFYSSQEEYDAENPFIVDSFAKKGPSGSQPKLKGIINGNDFTIESDSSFNMTETSLDSFKGKVIENLAGALGIDASDIS